MDHPATHEEHFNPFSDIMIMFPFDAALLPHYLFISFTMLRAEGVFKEGSNGQNVGIEIMSY